MVEIRTKLDDNTMKVATNIQIKKIWWLYLLFSLLFVLFGVLTLVEDKNMLLSGILFIVIGVLFTPCCILLTKYSQNSIRKSNPILRKDTFETYKFDENKFVIEQTKSNNFSNKTEGDYSYIYSVKETNKYWLFYITSSQMHLLPKDKIVKGNVEELNNIFKQKLGTKFLPYNKNK